MPDLHRTCCLLRNFILSLQYKKTEKPLLTEKVSLSCNQKVSSPAQEMILPGRMSSWVALNKSSLQRCVRQKSFCLRDSLRVQLAPSASFVNDLSLCHLPPIFNYSMLCMPYYFLNHTNKKLTHYYISMLWRERQSFGGTPDDIEHNI